jgi:hypothetical protein
LVHGCMVTRSAFASGSNPTALQAPRLRWRTFSTCRVRSCGHVVGRKACVPMSGDAARKIAQYHLFFPV